ncbi:general substrate transporter [Auricularia subglabra TFB-10046 SS5]|nr:general substrate transporter [Auricularia subglabra TFB-10046 SS5]
MPNAKSILFSAFVAFGGFLFGYDIGVISGCLIMPDFIDRFGEFDASEGKMVLSPSRQSIITSLLSAGTFIGALAQAFTSDLRYGRKGSIFTWSTIFTIGVAIQTGTERSIAQITVGRFIAGLGVGALSAIVPLYIGESAPKKIRGALIALYQLQIIFGLFLSYVLDLATHRVHGSASWRVPVGLQLAWGLILMVGILILPESPRHLLGQEREPEARNAIAGLNGVPEDDPLVQEIVNDLSVAIREENEGGKATWAECFSARNMLWKRTGNGMMLQFIQQLDSFCDQNFYYYYGDTFFQSAGTGLNPYVIQVIIGGVSVVGTIPALYLIETVGRRKSLLIGAAWQAACAIIASLVGHYTLASPDYLDAGLPLTNRMKHGGDVLIAFAVLHVFGFSMFWGPTPWVYLGESFPLRVRAKGIALGSATNWIWNFLLGFFAPRIANDIGPLILLIFFGALIFGFVYVWLCVPEVKGLSLEEIDELYRSGVKPWHSVGWKPSGGRYAHKDAIVAHEKGEPSAAGPASGEGSVREEQEAKTDV